MFAKEVDDNTQVVYLTPDGHAPSPSSAEGLTGKDGGYEEVKQISFADDILMWLKDCLSLPETIRKAPIREIITQFISAIERFTGKLEDRTKFEMVELLSASPQNMKNAKTIADSLPDCQADIVRWFNAHYPESFLRCIT